MNTEHFYIISSLLEGKSRKSFKLSLKINFFQIYTDRLLCFLQQLAKTLSNITRNNQYLISFVFLYTLYSQKT